MSDELPPPVERWLELSGGPKEPFQTAVLEGRARFRREGKGWWLPIEAVMWHELGRNHVADLRVGLGPLAFVRDRRAALGSPMRESEQMERAARVMQYIRAYRVRGYLLSDLDPLVYEPTSFPELDYHRGQHLLIIRRADRSHRPSTCQDLDGRVATPHGRDDRLAQREVLE